MTPAPNSATVPPPGQPQPQPLSLSQAQLEQLVAPIALYPDPLLAQILMAATYPLEVIEATRWASANHMDGQAQAAALQSQNWDPSVKSLIPFPHILENMSNQVQWTEALGNAFLAQQPDVMAAIQDPPPQGDGRRHAKTDAAMSLHNPNQRRHFDTTGAAARGLRPLLPPTRLWLVVLSAIPAGILPAGAVRVRVRARLLDRISASDHHRHFLAAVLGLGLV